MSTPESDRRLRFPRRLRLTRGSDLQAIIREGKRIRTRYLDVRMRASPLDHPRFGIVVPRHQHTAVDRNRLKRQLRELVRERLASQIMSGDFVIRARREAYDADLAALAQDIEAVHAPG